MQKLKLAYFGSPSFSADLLEQIILDKTLPVEIVLVVTQPDKPVGRKQILTPSPVKSVALKYNIEIYNQSLIYAIGGATRGAPLSAQGNRALIGAEERQNLLHKLQSFDLSLVFAFGEIIPKDILSLPKYGFWNIHPSLLPLYRGASPIAYPLILGDNNTGVSLMLMDEKMDQGPLLAQEKIEILPTDTRTDLEIKLTNLAFNIFKKQINKLSTAKNADFLPGHLCNNTRATPPASLTLARDKKYAFELIPQNHAHATCTYRFKKSDGFILLNTLKKMLNNKRILTEELPVFLQKYINKYMQKQAAIQLLISSSLLLLNIYNGLSPWPGLWTLIAPTRCNADRQKRLKITEMKIVDNKPSITKVQLEGKKEVDFTTFQKAYSLF